MKMPITVTYSVNENTFLSREKVRNLRRSNPELKTSLGSTDSGLTVKQLFEKMPVEVASRTLINLGLMTPVQK